MSDSTVRRLLRRLGFSRKKDCGGDGATKVDPERLVFVDEMGANISLCPLYAWSPKGERAHAKVPRNRGKNTTLLASMGVEGMGHCLAVEGSTTAAVFESYVEQVLSPSLRPGQLVVMDNLTAHKGRRIEELIEERGCDLVYLPPYSPDLNPIEEAFSKIKRLMRKAEARTRKALIEAMGLAISAVTHRDVRGFFEHCGYRIPVQPFMTDAVEGVLRGLPVRTFWTSVRRYSKN